MPRFVTICFVAATLFCSRHASATDGFEPVGFRSFVRFLGMGFGPGYHHQPCMKHLAKHYHRSAQGIVHPAHRFTPLYLANSPQLRDRFGPQLLPGRAAAGPCVHQPEIALPSDRIESEPYPKPMPATRLPGDDENGDKDEGQRRESPRIERLPEVDANETISEVLRPSLHDLDPKDLRTMPDAVMGPLMGHPLWEENGPAQPRLYLDDSSQ
jgi:hypothetical protein